MFRMDPEYWEEYFDKRVNKNLKKENTPDNGKVFGALPKELFPGYRPALDVDPGSITGLEVPKSLGGGVINEWKTTYLPPGRLGGMASGWRGVVSDVDSNGDYTYVVFYGLRSSSSSSTSHYNLRWSGLRHMSRDPLSVRTSPPDVVVLATDNASADPVGGYVIHCISRALWDAKTLAVDEAHESIQSFLDLELVKLINNTGS